MCAGNLRLKKLRLKPDALQEFQLPVKLKHGYVGSLHIVIPFVGITSTPVQVNLEDVFLVMGLMREFDGRAHIKGMRGNVQDERGNAHIGTMRGNAQDERGDAHIWPERN